MLKNLKLDIIYYSTPSDFEFEFNLGGYCRSRILNSKSDNIKDMVKQLAVAVNRSRVIIIIGKMLGENGCILPVSKAISKKTVSVDHRQYHITSPEPIELIEGSLPLVTSDGEFGGCIIESGPQSIIFLSENKKLRKKVSEQLLSRYLESLSRTPDTENDLIFPEDRASDIPPTAEETDDTLNNTDISNTEETTVINEISEKETEIEETDELQKIDINSEKSDETLEENEIINIEEEISPEITTSETEEFEAAKYDNSDSFIIPLSSSKASFEDFYSNDDNAWNDSDETELNDDFKHTKSKENSKKSEKSVSALTKIFIVLVAALLIFAALLIYFTVYLPHIDGIPFNEYLEKIFAFRGAFCG